MRLFRKGRGSVVKGSDAMSGDQLAAAVDGTTTPAAEGVPPAQAKHSTVEGSAQGLKPPLDTAHGVSTTAAASAGSAHHEQGQLVVYSSTEQYLQNSSTDIQLNAHCLEQSSTQLSQLQGSHAQPVQDSFGATKSSPAQGLQDPPVAAPLCSGPVAATACDARAVTPAAAEEHLTPGTAAAAAKEACNTAGAGADSLMAMQGAKVTAVEATAAVAEAVPAAGAETTAAAPADTAAGLLSRSPGQQDKAPGQHPQQTAVVPPQAAASPAASAGISMSAQELAWSSPCLSEAHMEAVSTGSAAGELSHACKLPVLQDMKLAPSDQGSLQQSATAVSTGAPSQGSPPACNAVGRPINMQDRPISPAERRQQASEAIERLKQAMAASAQLLRSASAAGSQPSTPRTTCSAGGLPQTISGPPGVLAAAAAAAAAAAPGKLLRSASVAGSQHTLCGTPSGACSAGGMAQAGKGVLAASAPGMLLRSASAVGSQASTPRTTCSAGGMVQAGFSPLVAPGVLAAAASTNLLSSASAAGSQRRTPSTTCTTGGMAQTFCSTPSAPARVWDSAATGKLLCSPSAAGGGASTTTVEGSTGLEANEVSRAACCPAATAAGVSNGANSMVSTKGTTMAQSGPATPPVAAQTAISDWDASSGIALTAPAALGAYVSTSSTSSTQPPQSCEVSPMQEGPAASVTYWYLKETVYEDTAGATILQAPCSSVLDTAVTAAEVAPTTALLQTFEDPAGANVLQAPCSIVLGFVQESAVTAAVTAAELAPATAPSETSEDHAEATAVLQAPCSTVLEFVQQFAVTAAGTAAEVAPATAPSETFEDPAEATALLQAPCSSVLASAQKSVVTATGAPAEVAPGTTPSQLPEEPAGATVLQAPCSNVRASVLHLAVTAAAAPAEAATAAPAAVSACPESPNAADKDTCVVHDAPCGMQSGTTNSTRAAEGEPAVPAAAPSAVTAAPCLEQADAAKELDAHDVEGASDGMQSGAAHSTWPAAEMAAAAPAAAPSAETAAPCLETSTAAPGRDPPFHGDAQGACMQSGAAHSVMKPAEVMSPGDSPSESRRGSLHSSSATNTDLNSIQCLSAVQSLTAAQAGSFAGLGGLEGHTEPASLNGSSNGAAATGCTSMIGVCSIVPAVGSATGGNNSCATAHGVQSLAKTNSLSSSESGSAAAGQSAGSAEVQQCFRSLCGVTSSDKLSSSTNRSLSGVIKGRANGGSKVISITADSSNCSTGPQPATTTETMPTAAVHVGSHAITDSLSGAASGDATLIGAFDSTGSGSSGGPRCTDYTAAGGTAVVTEAEAERAGQVQLQQLLLSKQLLQAAKAFALEVFDQAGFLQEAGRLHDESQVLLLFEDHRSQALAAFQQHLSAHRDIPLLKADVATVSTEIQSALSAAVTIALLSCRLAAAEAMVKQADTVPAAAPADTTAPEPSTESGAEPAAAGAPVPDALAQHAAAPAFEHSGATESQAAVPVAAPENAAQSELGVPDAGSAADASSAAADPDATVAATAAVEAAARQAHAAAAAAAAKIAAAHASVRLSAAEDRLAAAKARLAVAARLAEAKDAALCAFADAMGQLRLWEQPVDVAARGCKAAMTASMQGFEQLATSAPANPSSANGGRTEGSRPTVLAYPVKKPRAHSNGRGRSPSPQRQHVQQQSLGYSSRFRQQARPEQQSMPPEQQQNGSCSVEDASYRESAAQLQTVLGRWGNHILAAAQKNNADAQALAAAQSQLVQQATQHEEAAAAAASAAATAAEKLQQLEGEKHASFKKVQQLQDETTQQKADLSRLEAALNAAHREHLERLQVIMTLSEELQQHKAADPLQTAGSQQTAAGAADPSSTIDSTNATGSVTAADTASAVEAALAVADDPEIYVQPKRQQQQQQEQHELWSSAAGASTSYPQPDAVHAVPAAAAAAAVTPVHLLAGDPSHPWDGSAFGDPEDVSPGLVVDRVAVMQAELDVLEAIAAALAAKALPGP